VKNLIKLVFRILIVCLFLFPNAFCFAKDLPRDIAGLVPKEMQIQNGNLNQVNGGVEISVTASLPVDSAANQKPTFELDAFIVNPNIPAGMFALGFYTGKRDSKIKEFEYKMNNTSGSGDTWEKQTTSYGRIYSQIISENSGINYMNISYVGGSGNLLFTITLTYLPGGFKDKVNPWFDEITAQLLKLNDKYQKQF
jgi:hypothetical protein